jgi:integrase
MGRRQNGVRAATQSSIAIDFYYQGVRCRERVKLAPTKANQKFVENLKAQILTEIARGTFDYGKYFPDSTRARSLAKLPGAAVTVGEGLDLWLAGKAGELQHSTFEDYRKDIKNTLKPAFGKLRLPDLTRAILKAWVAGKDCSLKRISNLLLPMRGMYDQALDDGLIAVNPFVGWTAKKVEAPKEGDDVDPFTQAEVAAILKSCEGQIRNPFQFAFWTGLRTSELIALRWEDVDLVNGMVSVRRAKVRKKIKVPKTRAGRRTVILLKPAADAIAAQRAHTQLAGADVFLNPRTGEPWEHDGPIR